MAAEGDLIRAATVLGAAAATLERGGGEWPPDELEQYKETLVVLGALSPGELERVRAGGAAMTRAEIVEYALE